MPQTRTVVGSTARAKRMRRLAITQHLIEVFIILTLAGLGSLWVGTYAPPPMHELTITVIGEGDTQADIDACKGPVLYQGMVVVEHNGCGGWFWLGLTVGAKVTLKGNAIRPGTYVVAELDRVHTGDRINMKGYPYAVQTCVDSHSSKFWYLQPV